MNSNRPVLQAKENRLPLKDVSSKIEIIHKKKLSTKTIFQQQENVTATVLTNKIPTISRPILTAIRSLKQQTKENEQHTEMLISPINFSIKQDLSRSDQQKTREQLEQDLYELPDYRQSIFEHLKSVEHIYAPKMNFMEHQSDINSAMRTILIDWLIEVADEYKLIDETLFLCVQYIDRFLSTVNVTRAKLQLLGTTCMYIAAKYEEMYPPALEEFSFITDNTYETKHILRMEQIIIKMLNFSLSGPTSYVFLQYYLTHLKPIDNNDDHKSVTMLSKYFCNLTLLHDRPFSSYRSSLIAASCLLLAIRLLNQDLNLDSLWSNIYIQLTTYTQYDLHECTLALAEIHSKTHFQDKITSSLLRRYLNTKKENEFYQKQVREIIHQSKTDDNDDDDIILDLTLDEFDNDNNMSMDLQR
jgi:Sec-independent protein translocase protein TatA